MCVVGGCTYTVEPIGLFLPLCSTSSTRTTSATSRTCNVRSISCTNTAMFITNATSTSTVSTAGS